MRCDLHVHTFHSGMCTIPGLGGFVRECYTQPRTLARALRQRGMNLITVTDHDAIGAVEQLGGEPDFFLSEEVTCTTPSGTEAHIGVYDITEAQHCALQTRRNDLPRLLAYVEEQHLFASVNHIASTLTGLRRAVDFETFAQVEAFEGMNGHIPESSNRCARRLGRRCGRRLVAGSDAHTLDSAACAFTEVPHARNKEEFFAGLRAGRARLRGQNGSWVQLTCDVFDLGLTVLREHPLALALAPLLPLVPIATALQFGADYAAAWWWQHYWRRPAARPHLAGVPTE